MSTGPAGALPPPDWAVQSLDKVDDIIAKVRTSTTGRLVPVVRGLVFAILAAVMGITAGVFAVIGLIRGLDLLLPGPVWSAYVLLGAIFTCTGVFLWSKRVTKASV